MTGLNSRPGQSASNPRSSLVALVRKPATGLLKCGVHCGVGCGGTGGAAVVTDESQSLMYLMSDE